MSINGLGNPFALPSETLAERRFRALVTVSAQIVWICSRDGRVCEDSSSWRSFTGQTLAEFVGFGWLDAIHPEDREITSLKWRQAVRAQTRYETIYRLRSHTGEWRWTTARGMPVFDDSGEIDCWVGINNDVTEQLNAKSALEESELQFRTLAENIPDLVWVADENAQITYWNPSWYAYTGQTVAQSLGLDAAAAVAPEFRAEALERWKDAVTRKVPFEMEFPLAGRSGEYQWFLARARAVRDARGEVFRWCGVLTNIDSQKKCAEDLVRERSNREQFVNTLVHDLKNVIGSGSVAMAELGDSNCPDEDRAPLARIVEHAFGRSHAMIKDLLDANAIDAGRAFRLQDWDDFNLLDCFASVIDRTFRSERERIRIRVPAALEVRWSRKDVVRMVENLVGNAVKYGDRDQPITVAAEARTGNVVWSVHNFGPAIPLEEQAAVFEFLVRSRRGRGGASEGWGIGLTLVRGIAAAHGGEVGVSSDPEQGTTFTMTMPARTKDS